MFNEFVYVLKAGPYFKIGRTNDVTRRIAQLSTQMPFPVELFKVINTDDSRALETLLHDNFHTQRVNGEWFELDDEAAILMYLFPANYPMNVGAKGYSGTDWLAFIHVIKMHFISQDKDALIATMEAYKRSRFMQAAKDNGG